MRYIIAIILLLTIVDLPAQMDGRRKLLKRDCNVYSCTDTTSIRAIGSPGTTWLIIEYSRIACGDSVIVIMKQGESINENEFPHNYQSYSVPFTIDDDFNYFAYSDFGDGDEISPGVYVVYNGIGQNQIFVGGLTRQTDYTFKVIEIKSCNKGIVYLRNPNTYSTRRTA